MPEGENPKPILSKRAARRIIQRAFVLMGRDKGLRQQIRESELTTLWIVEDWALEWTVFFHHGRFEVERRVAKRPHVTLSWSTADEFFHQADRAGEGHVQVQFHPAPGQRRFFEPLLRAFFATLRHVLSNPVDDAGQSLL